MNMIASQTIPIMKFSWERIFWSHWTILLWEIVQTWFHPSLWITKISWCIIHLKKGWRDTIGHIGHHWINFILTLKILSIISYHVLSVVESPSSSRQRPSYNFIEVTDFERRFTCRFWLHPGQKRIRKSEESAQKFWNFGSTAKDFKSTYIIDMTVYIMMDCYCFGYPAYKSNL